MRRRLVWGFVIATSAAYVVMIVWWLAASQGLPGFNELLWSLVMVPVPVAAGVYLMFKRPENAIGELLAVSSICSFMLLTLVEVPTLQAYERSGALDWMWWPVWGAQTATQVGVVLTLAMLVVLPDGHFRHKRERRLVRWSWIIVVFPTLSLVSNDSVVSDDLSFPGLEDIASPFVAESVTPYGSTLAALTPASYLLVLAALGMLFMRYRTASNRERKQVRWVLYGGTIGIVVALVPTVLGAAGLIPPLQHNMAAVVYSLPLLLFPISVVVAVVEPPWADVDIVIRKSFVYGALSFVILLLYIAAAAAFGVVAAGAQLDIEIAVILTVVVAMLFQPARRRLQLIADRWVFGARLSKYEAVREFGETLEQSAEPTELLPRLVETIRKTIRLQWVSATLDDGTHAESGKVPGQPILNVPIGVGTGEVGVIRCGPKLNGSIDDDERQLVQTLAAQVGVAVMNARLAGRIVNAAEAERRRIERNIHDGAQQELVALVARLGMAKTKATHGSLTPEAIDRLQQEAQHILSDLRDLAQGIHPSVLSDGGILEAVEDRCTHVPIDVSLQAPESLRTQRFHDDVEGAAYFFVSESLANALKHSGASRVEVTMANEKGMIRLGVTDNGCGFDSATTRQYGLAGLSDRIQALGGTMTISARPHAGTSVQAEIPASAP